MLPGIVLLKMGLTRLHDATCPSQNTGGVLNRENPNLDLKKMGKVPIHSMKACRGFDV
jgi:hypothetical protein